MVELFFIALLVSWAATGITLKVLRHYQILDNPNERSSHTLPTPRGGGWGIMAAVVPGVLITASLAGRLETGLWLGGALVFLMAVSWIDDMRRISRKARMAAQLIAVVIGYQALPDALIFQGLVPAWVEWAVIGFGWLWFINLYNFMDGIDGISGVETVSIAVGVATVALIALPGDGFALLLAAVLGGAAIGFLIWNWHPAKLFMGDIGSVPLGFILGFLLLNMAAQGYLIAALIIPLYYLVDATYTLLRRMLRGSRFWEAHREHFYQIACVGATGKVGRGHDKISSWIAFTNVGLVLCAALSLLYGWPLLIAAAALVALLCRYFYQLSVPR